jgi:hypothetical protein
VPFLAVRSQNNMERFLAFMPDLISNKSVIVAFAGNLVTGIPWRSNTIFTPPTYLLPFGNVPNRLPAGAFVNMTE